MISVMEFLVIKTNASDRTETLLDGRGSTGLSDLSKKAEKVTIQALWKHAVVIPIDTNRQHQPMAVLCASGWLLGRSRSSCWSYLCEWPHGQPHQVISNKS